MNDMICYGHNTAGAKKAIRIVCEVGLEEVFQQLMKPIFFINQV